MDTKIGYQINGSFYFKGKNGSVIGFDLPFPSIYSTKNEAEESNETIGLKLEKDGESIVLRLYENESLSETVRWDEWWRYRCYRTKQGHEGKKGFTDADFEPYYVKFEDIFKYYIKSENVIAYPLEYVQYWVEPIELAESIEKQSNCLQSNEEETLKCDKTLEEEFLTFTDEEENMKFVGFLHEEVVLIDELANVLKFNRDDYFNGKRFLTTKFEREILNYENLELRKVSFARFWKFTDGKYYKRVIGSTGLHMGYQFKYVKFNVIEDAKKDEFYL